MEDKILKVIVETCYLTEEEKIRLCECVTKGGADYIKTSTGFGTEGASLSVIALFRKHIGKNVKIKAAGGIRTKEDMEAFLTAKKTAGLIMGLLSFFAFYARTFSL